MTEFSYKAKGGPGEIIEGNLRAETQAAAIEKLSQMGYFPLSVAKLERREKRKLSFRLLKRVRRRDLSIFTRQLSDLLESGLTLLEALKVIEQQTENRQLKEALREMAPEIRDGKRLSESMSKRPGVFPPLCVNMIRSGEVGGMLEEVLRRLSDFLERDDELLSKLRAAMAYPILMASVGLLTIFVLLTLVIPKLVSMFEEMGQVLPLPTRILIGTSELLTHYGWLLALFLGLCYFFLRREFKSPKGELLMDGLRLKLPLLGKFFCKTEISRFSRTLGALLQNGIPILESLKVVAGSMQSPILREEIETVYRQLTQGEKLGPSLRNCPHFPIFVTNMISVGEESNLLERALFKVADSYDRDLERSVKQMTSLLEPIMILLMGSIVAFIVVSMMLPIFQIDLMAQ